MGYIGSPNKSKTPTSKRPKSYYYVMVNSGNKLAELRPEQFRDNPKIGLRAGSPGELRVLKRIGQMKSRGYLKDELLRDNSSQNMREPGFADKRNWNRAGGTFKGASNYYGNLVRLEIKEPPIGQFF